MKKEIWIWNHYATGMFEAQNGRHYNFAKNLVKRNYKPVIFCSNIKHKTAEKIDIKESNYLIKKSNSIPFVFVKSLPSNGNGIGRIINMISFFFNLLSVSKKISITYGKPEVILASSVHPLTMLAGIIFGKRNKIPVICEVRDLWPETLVDMGKLKKKSFLARLMYYLEKYIYKKADRLIFTMPGGKDYVKSLGLDISKVRYINNGLDVELFNFNKINTPYPDKDLDNKESFKVVYTGSMGEANELSYLIKAAEILKNKQVKDIKFILYGDGPLREKLEGYVYEKQLNNVIFKGTIDKKYIPSVLGRSNLNIFTGKNINLYKYGLSLNKMFDYFGSGKPTIANIETPYDLIEKYKCGLTVKGGDSNALAKGILHFYYMSNEEYNSYCENALQAAKYYDFKILTDKLEKVFLEVV